MTAIDSSGDMGSDVFIVSTDHCCISARTLMLFIPVAIKCTKNDKGGDSCYIVPLGPRVNCRDVSISRLMDKMQTNLIENGSIHVLPGSYKQSHCNGRQELELTPVLSGARDAIPHDYIFSPDIDFDFLKARILLFLQNLSLSNCHATPNHHVVEDFKNTSKEADSANDILLRFMIIIDTCYSQFNEVTMYNKLLQAVALLTTNDSPALDDRYKLPTIHHESLSAPVHAMREFQKSFGPFIVSIMSGGHRVMRMFMETFGCQHSDFDPTLAGFYLPPNAAGHERTLTRALTIRLLAYEKKGGTGDLTAEQLLSVSYNQNEKAEKSVTLEDCHL